MFTRKESLFHYSHITIQCTPLVSSPLVQRTRTRHPHNSPLWYCYYSKQNNPLSLSIYKSIKVGPLRLSIHPNQMTDRSSIYFRDNSESGGSSTIIHSSLTRCCCGTNPFAKHLMQADHPPSSPVIISTIRISRASPGSNIISQRTQWVKLKANRINWGDMHAASLASATPPNQWTALGATCVNRAIKIEQ